MSRVIRDLQSRSCFRFHHSRTGEASSVPWDISTSREEQLSAVEEEAECKSPSADDKGQPADPSQSSFTGLLKRMEQRGVIKRVTLQSEAELCEGKPDCVTSKKRLVPPLHPLLRIATAEVFKDPADCHPSSFMGHRVYPVAKDTSPFQPNPPAGGPIVEALEHSRRGGTTSPLDSTSKEMDIIFCLLLTPGSKTHTCCPRTQRAQEQRGCLACSPRESRTAPGTLQELTDTLLMEGKKERRGKEDPER